jgi:hypothetical protein
VIVVQAQGRAQRKDGGVRGLSAISLKVRRSLTEHVDLTGHAYSAITDGGAHIRSVSCASASPRDS